MRHVLNMIPPLGLAWIAASIRDLCETRIMDCSKRTRDEFQSTLRHMRPDIVGITCTTPTYPISLEMAKTIRKSCPKAIIVIGGPHVSAVPEISLDGFDVGVIGEGEMTFRELCSHYPDIDSMRKTPGTAHRIGDRIIMNAPRPPVDDLDVLPLPAWDMLAPLSEYRPTPASFRRLPYAHVMTSRGCPSHCTFCDRGVFGSSYRERSAANVLDEIDLLMREHGVREIKFFDDTFTLNRKRLGMIAHGMKKRGIIWSCLTRADKVDRDMLRMMKACGCWQILFGLESGDEEVLRKLGKGTTLRQNRDAIKMCRQEGISTRADFLIGTPFENREAAERTVRFAIETDPDFAHFNKFTPYPGTQLYRMLISQGHKLDLYSTASQLDHSKSIYTPSWTDAEGMERFINDAHRRFYMRPGYILRQAASVRSLTDISRMARGAAAIFRL